MTFRHNFRNLDSKGNSFLSVVLLTNSTEQIYVVCQKLDFFSNFREEKAQLKKAHQIDDMKTNSHRCLVLGDNYDLIVRSGVTMRSACTLFRRVC